MSLLFPPSAIEIANVSLGSAPGEFYKTRLLPAEMLADASRKDALPEHIKYNANTGCRAWKRCLTCPFVDCIEGDGFKRFDGALLRLKVTLALHPRQGMTTLEAAERIGVTRRTVQAIAAENRARGLHSERLEGENMPVPAAWVREQAARGTNRNVELLRQLRTPAEARQAREKAEREKVAAERQRKVASHKRNVAAREANKAARLGEETVLPDVA